MASFKRSLRWRAPDLSRISFAELRRLDMPFHCWVDGLDLDLEGKFTGICVSWATSLGPDFRLEVEARIERWWRDLRGQRRNQPLATVIPFRQADR